MKSPCLLHQVTGDPQCPNWGWQCIKLDGVSVVSIDVSDAVGAAHTLCLHIFVAAILQPVLVWAHLLAAAISLQSHLLCINKFLLITAMPSWQSHLEQP